MIKYTYQIAKDLVNTSELYLSLHKSSPTYQIGSTINETTLLIETGIGTVSLRSCWTAGSKVVS